METKNLRKTEGLPFNLGVASGVLLLLGAIFQFDLQQVESQAVLQAMQKIMQTSIPQTGASSSPLSGPIGIVVSYLIYPGIFLLLLFLGEGKEKRGSAFAIVWIVFSGISLISTIIGVFTLKTLFAKADTTISAALPMGYWLRFAFVLAGDVLMIASCIAFLKRLSEPHTEEDTMAV